EVILSLRHLLRARGGVHADAIAQFACAGCQHLVERRMGLVVLTLLHQAESSFVVSHQLCAATVVCLRNSSSDRAGDTLYCWCCCCFCLSHRSSCRLRRF